MEFNQEINKIKGDIKELEKHTNGIRENEGITEDRLNDIENRLSKIEERIEKIEKWISEHEKKHDSIDEVIQVHQLY